MKIKGFVLTLGCAVIPMVIVASTILPSATRSADAQTRQTNADAKIVPVEDDMHEFMEYVF